MNSLLIQQGRQAGGPKNSQGTALAVFQGWKRWVSASFLMISGRMFQLPPAFSICLPTRCLTDSRDLRKLENLVMLLKLHCKIIATTLQIKKTKNKKKGDSEWPPSFSKRDHQLIGGLRVEWRLPWSDTKFDIFSHPTSNSGCAS